MTYEAHVNRYEQNDRLCEQDAERTGDVLAEQFFQVDFNFLLLRMNARFRLESLRLGCIDHVYAPPTDRILEAIRVLDMGYSLRFAYQFRVFRRRSEAFSTRITGP